MKNPNGFGTVEKLSGNRRRPYRARVTVERTPDGKQIRKTIGYYESRKDALIALAEYNHHPWYIGNQKLTFYEVYQQSEKLRNHDNKKVESQLKSAYNKYLNPLSKMPIANVKHPQLQAVIDGMSDKAIGTKQLVKRIMNQVFKFAIDNDIVTKNYVQTLKVVDTLNKEKLHKPMTTEQLRDMRNDNIFEKDIAFVLCMTGFRVDELLELETANIDIENRTMIGGKKTKAGTNRIVPISRHIEPIIKAYYNPEQKYLFVNKNKNRIIYSNYRIKFKKHFPDNTTHDCRHTFSTIASNAELNAVAVQKIMGHVGTTITETVYTHKNAEQLIKAIDIFDDYVENLLS